MHRCMLGRDWLQAHWQPPHPPSNSLFLMQRWFFASEGLFCSIQRGNHGNGGLTLRMLLQLRQAWPEFLTASEAGEQAHMTSATDPFLIIGSQDAQTSILCRHGWPETVVLPLPCNSCASASGSFRHLWVLLWKCRLRKEVEKVFIILALMKSRAIRCLLLAPLVSSIFRC